MYIILRRALEQACNYVIIKYITYATSVYTFPVPDGVTYNNNKENTPLELCVLCMVSWRVSFSTFCSCIQPTKHNAIIRTDVVSVATRGVLCALAMYYSIIL